MPSQHFPLIELLLHEEKVSEYQNSQGDPIHAERLEVVLADIPH